MKYKITGLIITVVMICMLTGCEEKAKSYIEQGMDALEQYDYGTAAGLFDSALSNDENPQQAYRGKGMALLGLARYSEAEQMFLNALSKSNGTVGEMEYDISYYLAVAQAKAGKYDEAFDTYSAIIAMNEKAQDAYYLRGKISLSRGDKGAALDDFDMSIILAPTDYDGYIRICKDLTGSGYESEGKAYIQRAMNTDYKKSDYQMGVFHYYMGEYEDARSCFEKSHETKTTKDLIVHMGKTYEALGDYNYAVSLYNEYLASHSDEAELYLQLGRNKMTQGDYEGAVSAFEAGTATNNVEYIQSLKFNRIVAYEYMLDFKMAAKLMEEYVREYPEDEDAEREYRFLQTR